MQWHVVVLAIVYLAQWRVVAMIKTWVVTFKYLSCDIFHSQHNGAAGEYRLRQRLPVAVPRAVACGSSILQVPAGVILKSRLFG